MDKPSMFEQSRSLIAGAKIIIDSKGINDAGVIKYPTTPVIMCSAFAIEICLKLILLCETQIKVQGHNLDDLYKKMPSTIISKVIECYLKQNPNETEKLFHVNIIRHKDIFIKWRYAYETESLIECSPNFLYSFAYTLNIFIEDNYEFKRNKNGWIFIK